jgi:hypothetical protein
VLFRSVIVVVVVVVVVVIVVIVVVVVVVVVLIVIVAAAATIVVVLVFVVVREHGRDQAVDAFVVAIIFVVRVARSFDGGVDRGRERGSGYGGKLGHFDEIQLRHGHLLVEF